LQNAATREKSFSLTLTVRTLAELSRVSRRWGSRTHRQSEESMNSEPSKCVSSLIRTLNRLAIPFGILRLLLVAVPFSTFAQEATIVGTVTDPSDALVPGAKITLTNVETGLSQSITTNQDGQYVVSNLRIGHYDITADSKGFKVAERKGIVLNVGDRTRVDFHLQMSGAAETVTVESDAVRVQTDTGEVSEVITGKQVTQLATNGRSLYTLVNLTPGTSSLQGDFQTPTTLAGDAGVSVNGSRPIHTLYMIDGGEDNDRGGGGFDVLPSLDSLAEFRMMTSNYSAEYGLSTAGTIHSAIKSGTKQFHASAWEFVRNDALNARLLFPCSQQNPETSLPHVWLQRRRPGARLEVSPDVLLLQHGMAQPDFRRLTQPSLSLHCDLRRQFLIAVWRRANNRAPRPELLDSLSCAAGKVRRGWTRGALLAGSL
jgi:hypothetical protein